MTPRICVSILPKTTAEAMLLLEKAEENGADFVEIRLDCLEPNSKLTDLTAHPKVPKIATDRSNKSEGERQAILLNAAKSGFEYVDTDLSNPNLKSFSAQVKAAGAKLIVSFHVSNTTPSLSKLNGVFEREISAGAEVCKIVTTAKRLEDNLTLLQFVQAASAKAKVVCFGMGELGKTSRLLSPVFGGFFTFVALEKGSETASGQMTLKEMKTAYELLGLK